MKTLLLGLDGATFDVLDPLIAEGVMPFLGRFLEGGSRAPLRTIIPALTPPAWTSLMTGRSPGEHGVFDFFKMESTETRHIRFATSNDVNCETIWSMASRSGLRVASLNFPLMFPAPEISGYVIPGWVPWKVMRLACHPKDLYEKLRQLPGLNAREMGMDIKLEEKATEGCSDDEYEPWIELHTRREENWFRILRYILELEECDLIAIVFDGVDKLQHLCWRFVDPAYRSTLTEDWELRVRELCLEYFRRLDSILEQICELAGPQTNTLIASDHGFGPTEEVFYVNAWLEKQGWLAWTDEYASQDSSEEALLGVGKVARHTYQMDWDRTLAFATTPTSNGIYIVSEDSQGRGVPAARLAEFRAEIKQQLLKIASPLTGRPLIQNVWTREEAFPGKSSASAPDLTLELQDGGLVSILRSEILVGRRARLGGAHRPLGVFAAGGPYFRKGTATSELSILDVAPTVLYSLGLPAPSNLEGRLPTEIIEPTVLEQHPLENTHPSEKIEPEKKNETVLTPDDEALLLDRMRKLGYVE